MYFIVDEQRKIAVGWSAKCGCTHIKRIWLYLTHNIDEKMLIHKMIPCRGLPSNVEGYTVLIVGRNPYERLVSGFREKYDITNGACRKQWPSHIPLTFSNFVLMLARRRWNIIDQHHFVPQTQESFDHSKLKKVAHVRVCDLKNIDYGLLERIFQKAIPEEMRNWKGNHQSITTINAAYDNKDVSQLSLDTYRDVKLRTEQFYPPHIKRTVNYIFSNDFNFFALHNIYYN